MAGASKYAEYNQKVTHFQSHTMPLIDKSIGKVRENREKYKSDMEDAAKAKSDAAGNMAQAEEIIAECQNEISQASGDEDVSDAKNQLNLARMLYRQEEAKLADAERKRAAAEEGLEKTNARAQDLTNRCNTVIRVFRTMIGVIETELQNRQKAKTQLDQAAQTKFGQSAFLQSLRVDPEILKDQAFIRTCNGCISELKKKLSNMNGEGEQRDRDRGEERDMSR